MYRNLRKQPVDGSDGSPPSEAWLFAQAILGNPIPRVVSPEARSRAEHEELQRLAPFSSRHAEELRRLQVAESEARHDREVLEWAAQISTEAADKLRALRCKAAAEREACRRGEQFAETLLEGNWDPSQHPRLGGPPNPGWWATTGGAAGTNKQAALSLGGNTVKSPFFAVSAKKSKALSSAGTVRDHTPLVPPRPTLNSEGVELAGAGPETTHSYKDKVQKALETLDPDIARWWNANSVKGQIRSRAAGWWQSKSRSWLDGNDQPVIEVDQNFTSGQTAQAIIAEVKGGWFADSIGVFYKKYKFARSGDIEEFRKWQQGATAEAAHLASVLAELYVSSIATLTPAGDLVVTLGDLAENGPRWDQLLSILPYVGHLPVAAIVLKLGKRQVKIPKALARKLELLTDKERKSILVAVASAKTDDEATAIVKREAGRLVGDRQIHHPISDMVHKALEKHPNLKGKYQLRDKRFENLAKDYELHHGYEEWHRKLDKEVEVWLDRNKDATEATFEKWLRERYSKPDLKSRFPKNF